jgi:hypothetical protein
MQEVQKLLSNPLIRYGLRAAAPEVAVGIELIMGTVGAIMGSKKRVPYAKHLLALTTVIDKRLAEVLEVLATTKSKHRRREYEVRAHELLGILNEWEKIT